MIGLKVKYEGTYYIIYISKGVNILVTTNLSEVFFSDVNFMSVEDNTDLIYKNIKPILKRTDDFFSFYIDVIVKNF